MCVCVELCQLLTDCDRLTMDVWESCQSLPPTQRPVHHVLATSSHGRRGREERERGSRAVFLGSSVQPNGGYILSIVLIYISLATFCGCHLLSLGPAVRFRFFLCFFFGLERTFSFAVLQILPVRFVSQIVAG